MSLEYSRIPYQWDERRKWHESELPELEFAGRTARLLTVASERGYDSVIVHGGPAGTSNLRYLTNYDSSWGDSFLIIPTSGQPVLVTGALLHGEPMHSSLHTTWIRDIRPLEHRHSKADPVCPAAVALEALLERGCRKSAGIGFASLPAVHAEVFANVLAGSMDDVILDLRAVKSQAEIEIYRRGGRVVDAAFQRAADALAPGVTECDVAAEFAWSVTAAGGQLVSISVGFGSRSSLKNVTPSLRRAQRGDTVLIDSVVAISGYLLDTCRCFGIGQISPRAAALLEASLAANQAIQDAAKPGVPIAELQALARSVAAKQGLEAFYYANALGHGGGLSLVEEPFFCPGTKDKLRANQVFYLEPILVEHGFCAANIEDTILVTETGVEPLTRFVRRNWSGAE